VDLFVWKVRVLISFEFCLANGAFFLGRGKRGVVFAAFSLDYHEGNLLPAACFLLHIAACCVALAVCNSCSETAVFAAAVSHVL
jgi:hypothetical protein